MISIRSGSASPLGFEAVLLEAVAACLIGGVALEGGKGGFLGILIGLFTIRLVIAGMGNIGAPFWAQDLVVGLMLMFVVATEAVSAALGRRRVRAKGRAGYPYPKA